MDDKQEKLEELKKKHERKIKRQENKEVNVVGKNNLFKHKEFNDVDKIQGMFEKFDDKETMLSIEEKNDNNDINIYIGKENNLDDDVTIIKTNYKTNKDNGTIAIIGPKRMEYSRVVNLLEYIKKQIEGDKNGWR